MDVNLLIRVIRRSKLLVSIGLFLATLLAVFAYASISFDGASPKLTVRGTETWEAESKILITQGGFPYGRAVPKYVNPQTPARGPAIQLGDQSRFASLAQVYAGLFNGDAVRTQLSHGPPEKSTVKADPGVDPSGLPLPLVTITVTEQSKVEARALAAEAVRVFVTYVTREQERAGIGASDRTELQTLERGDRPVLIAPRKKTLPILVFVAIMAATLGLALMLENVRGNRDPTFEKVLEPVEETVERASAPPPSVPAQDWLSTPESPRQARRRA